MIYDTPFTKPVYADIGKHNRQMNLNTSLIQMCCYYGYHHGASTVPEEKCLSSHTFATFSIRMICV